MLWPNSPAHVIFSSVSNTDHQSMANKILYSFSLFTKQSLPLPLGPPLKALTFFAYLFPIEAAPSPRFQNHKDMKIHPPCCFSQAIVFLLSQEILPSLKFTSLSDPSPKNCLEFIKNFSILLHPDISQHHLGSCIQCFLIESWPQLWSSTLVNHERSRPHTGLPSPSQS